MAKSIAEINEKIKKGEAVVVTAEEIIGIVADKGIEKAAKEVDVVTTGTFGPMCSSGAFFNIGHAAPRIKLGGGKVYFNDVPVYAGLAAVDVFLVLLLFQSMIRETGHTREILIMVEVML